MDVFEIKNKELVEELMARRSEHRFPVQIRSAAKRFAHELLAVLFPHFTDHIQDSASQLDSEIQKLEATLRDILGSLSDIYPKSPECVVRTFIDNLPSIYHALLLDAKAIYHGDPAAVSVDEVILGYPGFYAIAIHRAAHELYKLKFHQGVTLGALVVQKHLSNRKRHPTIGDNVVVYANATILGGETEVGHDSVVGGNAWITESIPAFSIVGRNSDVRPRKPGAEADIEFNI